MIIAMAIWNTVANQRFASTHATIENLFEQVDRTRHRIFLINNGSDDQRTLDFLKSVAASGWATVIHNDTNLGTARAINKGWKHRNKGEHCVKMDDDILIHQKDWPDQLDEVFAREPKVGLSCLKRKDLGECPWAEDEHARSRLIMLPHKPGERWIVVEQVNLCMGTVQAYSSALLDKIGFLYQPGLYGLDDSLAAVRCNVAGFAGVFLPHIEIDSCDNIEPEYTAWKRLVAGKDFPEFERLQRGYRDGSIPIYHGGEE